eukprot:gnl/Chilomastix_cuspidata/4005.p1 GENE.gnl/Chilomastix_cuspidata/4005~~gnl/Chilomastix_cuspidata/4005.p1  ORF type:complete len:470 (+),score=101.79 gnl/Chilomastix_cuspidata/4005:57-1412(+)
MFKHHRDWRLSQLFGGSTANQIVSDNDIVSRLKFDTTGDHIAVGDRGGRLVLFNRKPQRVSIHTYKSTRAKSRVEYQFLTEIQSHEESFDPLFSAQVLSEIRSIEWFEPTRNARFVMAANARSARLWAVSTQSRARTVSTTAQSARCAASPADLRFPSFADEESFVRSRMRGEYTPPGPAEVHSVSASADGVSFLAATTTGVYTWNVERPAAALECVQLKGTEGASRFHGEISSCIQHPFISSVFALATSAGSVHLCDARLSALCNNPNISFYSNPPRARTAATAHITSLLFSRTPHQLVSRDLRCIRRWDVRMGNNPLDVVEVNPRARAVAPGAGASPPFRVAETHDGRFLATGTFADRFHVYDADGATGLGIKATEALLHRHTRTPSSARRPGGFVGAVPVVQAHRPVLANIPDAANSLRYISELAAHPTRDALAIANRSSLFIFSAAS